MPFYLNHSMIHINRTSKNSIHRLTLHHNCKFSNVFEAVYYRMSFIFIGKIRVKEEYQGGIWIDARLMYDTLIILHEPLSDELSYSIVNYFSRASFFVTIIWRAHDSINHEYTLYLWFENVAC